MVGTICPMVHGARTKVEGNQVLLMHTDGSILGAALTGAIAGACGALVFGTSTGHRKFAVALLAFFSILYVLDEFRVIRLPHPQSRLRVSANWRLGNHKLAAGLYGLGLGFGVGTAIPFSVFYIAIAWCVLVGHPFMSAIGFVGFGVGRALPIILLSRRKTVDEASDVVNTFCWNLPLLRLVNTCALTFAASILLLNWIYS